MECRGRVLSVFLLLTVSYGLRDIVEETIEVNIPQGQSRLSAGPSKYVPPNPDAPVDFLETFQDGKWQDRWSLSRDDRYNGQFGVSSGKDPQGIEDDLGLKVLTPKRRGAIARYLDHPIDFAGSSVVVQYEVRFQMAVACSGAYLKLFSFEGDRGPDNLSGDQPFSIMFGPDICDRKKVIQFILQYKNRLTGKISEHALKDPPKLMVSHQNDKTHVYTLEIKQDRTFRIFVDYNMVGHGNLLDAMDPPVTPPMFIDDPDDRKPDTWDDREEIPDVDATKPDDWDENAPEMIEGSESKPEWWREDEPEMIPDPDAVKPDSWDDDADGEWFAPLIDNPLCLEYGCGEWSPPLVKNPDFKGKWVRPMKANPNYSGVFTPTQIPNPGYYSDAQPENVLPVIAVGFEIYTMEDQILFDNIVIGRDFDVIKRYGEATGVVKHYRQVHYEEIVAEINLEREIAEKFGPGVFGKFLYGISILPETIAELNYHYPTATPIVFVVCVLFSVAIGFSVIRCMNKFNDFGASDDEYENRLTARNMVVKATREAQAQQHPALEGPAGAEAHGMNDKLADIRKRRTRPQVERIQN